MDCRVKPDGDEFSYNAQCRKKLRLRCLSSRSPNFSSSPYLL